MSEDSSEKSSASIDKIRSQVKTETEKKWPWMKGTSEGKLEIETKTFERLSGDQITIELAVSLLKLKESHWRENANQDLSDYKGGIGSEMAFNIWNEAHDALNGATGKDKVSFAIDYFRQRATNQRDIIERIRKQLAGEAPIHLSKGTPIFEHIKLIGDNVPKFQHAAKNYDTAARLFENQVNFEVPKAS